MMEIGRKLNDIVKMPDLSWGIPVSMGIESVDQGFYGLVCSNTSLHYPE